MIEANVGIHLINLASFWYKYKLTLCIQIESKHLKVHSARKFHSLTPKNCKRHEQM